MSEASALVGGWVPFTVCTCLSTAFSTGYILWYRSNRPQDQSRTASAICVVALTVTLLAAALVPVDVFLVSYMKNANGTFKDWAVDPETRQAISGQMMTAYCVLYGLIMALAFLVLPMTFFFHALGDEDDPDDDDFLRNDPSADANADSCGRRFCRAFKYTLASLFLFGLLVLMGLFLPQIHPTSRPDLSLAAPALRILEHVTFDHDNTRLENLLLFLVNVLNLIGMTLLIVYTAYGMSVLPCGMIVGSDTVYTERDAVNREIGTLETQINELKDEFSGREESMTEIDKMRLNRMERELRLLNRNRHNLEQAAKSFLNRCVLICRPFQLVFGAFFTLFGFMIFLSLLLTSVDKAINGLGPQSGYVLDNATLPNPVDSVLVYAQSVFPLDYVIYSGMVLFFLFSSMSGLRQIGIRFLWLSVYKVRSGRTKPQAIVLMCFNLTFILLALNVVMFSVVPDYTTYGSQRFTSGGDNGTAALVHECDHLEAPETECVMTRIAVLLLSFNYKIWFFGAAYYWLVWAFLASVVAGSVVAMYKVKQRSPFSSSGAGNEDYDQLLAQEDAVFRPTD